MTEPARAADDHSQRREDRITMRISPTHKMLIERAAKARGLSVTDYLTSVALADAQTTLIERTVFALDDEAYDRVCEMLDRQPQDNPQLDRLFSKNRRKKWKVNHNI